MPKIIVVLGLTLVCLTVLMLPLDVANRQSNGGFDMDFLWNMVYVLQGLFSLLFIPSALFYYESEDPESREARCWTAIKFELSTVSVVIGIWLVFWVSFGTAEIPVADYVSNVTLVPLEQVVNCADFFQQQAYCATHWTRAIISIATTPIVYFMAILAFFGWFFFVVFVGIGLASLPMDLLIDFTTRPQTIDLQEYAKQKMLLNERAQKLMEGMRRGAGGGGAPTRQACSARCHGAARLPCPLEASARCARWRSRERSTCRTSVLTLHARPLSPCSSQVAQKLGPDAHKSSASRSTKTTYNKFKQARDVTV